MRSKRFNAGHLVDGNRATGVVDAGRSLVNLADVGALGIEGGIGLRGQPVTDAMWFEVGLFFKKRPTERCEMRGTRPRRMASSAISRWLQWLIGRRSPITSRRSSQSPRRSARACTSRELQSVAHRPAARPRNARRLPVAIACANTAPSSAKPRVPVRSHAHACHRPHAGSSGHAPPTAVASNRFVPSCSSTSRCSGKMVTGSAANRGIATSHLSSEFVMPQHSRFNSCLVPKTTFVQCTFVPP